MLAVDMRGSGFRFFRNKRAQEVPVKMSNMLLSGNSRKCVFTWQKSVVNKCQCFLCLYKAPVLAQLATEASLSYHVLVAFDHQGAEQDNGAMPQVPWSSSSVRVKVLVGQGTDITYEDSEGICGVKGQRATMEKPL